MFIDISGDTIIVPSSRVPVFTLITIALCNNEITLPSILMMYHGNPIYQVSPLDHSTVLILHAIVKVRRTPTQL